MCADRGVCLCVCTLTHSQGSEREIVSVLLAAPFCETEGCPGFYRVSSRSVVGFLENQFFFFSQISPSIKILVYDNEKSFLGY